MKEKLLSGSPSPPLRVSLLLREYTETHGEKESPLREYISAGEDPPNGVLRVLALFRKPATRLIVSARSLVFESWRVAHVSFVVCQGKAEMLHRIAGVLQRGERTATSSSGSKPEP